MASYSPVLAMLTFVFAAVLIITTTPPLNYVCSAPPGFSCSYITVNTTGAMLAKFSQALGTQITINGVACADQQNYTYDSPLYGNVGVNSLRTYYPATFYEPGNTFYSGTSFIVSSYCYSANAKASGLLGYQFTGYVWLNYTVPGYGYQIEKVATFAAPYTKGKV